MLLIGRRLHLGTQIKLCNCRMIFFFFLDLEKKKRTFLMDQYAITPIVLPFLCPFLTIVAALVSVVVSFAYFMALALECPLPTLTLLSNLLFISMVYCCFFDWQIILIFFLATLVGSRFWYLFIPSLGSYSVLFFSEKYLASLEEFFLSFLRRAQNSF